MDSFFELRRPPAEAAELIRSVLGLLQVALYALRPLLSDDSFRTRGRAGLAVAALREVLFDLRALSAALGTSADEPAARQAGGAKNSSAMPSGSRKLTPDP